MVDDDKTGIYIVLIVAVAAVLGMMISFGDWNIPAKYLNSGITGYVISSEGLTTVYAKSLSIAPENQNNTQNFSCVWTNWKDRDNPSGTGDWETRVDFPDICSAPLAAQCQTTGGVDWANVNEVNVLCTPENGAICQNAYNPQGCSDYIVRFCCPSTTPPPILINVTANITTYENGTNNTMPPINTTINTAVNCTLGQTYLNGNCSKITEPSCTDKGYICTNHVGGCGGDYQTLNYSCQSGYFCCNGVSYCGDGVCDTTLAGQYTENNITCPQDCKPTVNSSIIPCTDTDGGKNYYLKGFVSGSNYHLEDYCNSDGQTLNEYTCNGNHYNYSQFTCTYGCSDGACRNATVNISSEVTLANYPYPFLNNDGSLNTNFVVGSNAAVADTIGVTDIVASLQRISSVSFETGIVKLDSSVSLSDNNNIISVGGSCANSVTAYAYEDNKHGKCEQGYSKGYGKISLVKKDNRYILAVSGYSAEDTAKATIVLSNWKDYADIFAGSTQICIYGSSNSGSIVKAC